MADIPLHPISDGPWVFQDGPTRSQSRSRSVSPSSSRQRQRSPQPPVDFHLLEYVSACDPNLICPICHAPLVHPKRLAQCDHIFCDGCLQRTFSETQRASEATGRSCPTCRRALEEKEKAAAIPRILNRMLDDLHVKCPNEEVGCAWSGKRVEVQDHVDFYCGHVKVECPAAPECNGSVLQKDVDRACPHFQVECEHCQESVMQVDLDKHLSFSCPRRFTLCSKCTTQVLFRDLAIHLKDDCSGTDALCTGAAYGCPYTCPRLEMTNHTSTCQIALMTPFLRVQAADHNEKTKSFEILQRKVKVLEGGFANIQSLLYPHGSNCAPSHSDTHTQQALSRRSRDYNTATAITPATSPTAPSPSATVDDYTTTLDTPTHHLLTLHESLRDELSRVGAAVAELDDRCAVRVMNETLRLKEDMAHMNAAINGLRAQMHWLTSERLMAQRARVAVATSASGSGASSGMVGGSGGSGGGGGAGGDGRFGQGSNSWIGEGAASGRGGVGGIGTGRKLSDSGRQETKL